MPTWQQTDCPTLVFTSSHAHISSLLLAIKNLLHIPFDHDRLLLPSGWHLHARPSAAVSSHAALQVLPALAGHMLSACVHLA